MAEDNAIVPETAETSEVTPENAVDTTLTEDVVEQTTTAEESFEFSKLSQSKSVRSTRRMTNWTRWPTRLGSCRRMNL